MPVRAIPIDQYPESAWRLVLGQPDGGTGAISASESVGLVPLLYRCVQIRARAVAGVPLVAERRGQSVDLDPALAASVRGILRAWEICQCVYGASYALLATTRLTRQARVRWLLPSTIEPQYDPATGTVAGFVRRVGGQRVRLALEELLYAWSMSLTAETGPGLAPVAVALAAAQQSHRLDQFVEQFFARGAINTYMVFARQLPAAPERDRIRSAIQRLFGGVKTANTVDVFSDDMRIERLNDALSDTVSESVTARVRDEVLFALEVPHSLVLPDAANYATAERDAMTFYETVVQSECELLLAGLAPWLARENLTVRVDMDQLSVFQSRAAQYATALQALAPAAILTVDEARARLGLPPLPVPPPPPAPPAPAPPAAADAAQAEGAAEDDAAEDDAARATALRQWQAKAQRRGAGVSFVTTAISAEDQAAVRDLLQRATDRHAVAHAFAAVRREPGADLTAAERQVYDLLVALLERHEARVLRAILADQQVDYATLTADLRATLAPRIAAAMLDHLDDLADVLGPSLDLPQAVAQWSTTYTADLANGITATTQRAVEAAIAQFRQTPGMTREQLRDLLRPAFGNRRADLIAVTEVTRAAAQATTQYQAAMAEAGIPMRRVWRTNTDERVCVICDALDGKREDAWSEQYPDGPPAHARCRCAVTLQLVRG